MCHLNLQGIQNLNAFQNYLHNIQHQFTVIGITETWLQNHNCNLYDMPGYALIECHRVTRMRGGVAIFLKDDVCYSIRTDLNHFDDVWESIFIEIDKDELCTNKNMIFGVIYRPPGTNMSIFNDMLKHTLEVIRKEEKICYIMGDYNINLLNSDSHCGTAEFVDIMFSNSFIPLITRPTRQTNETATLIDNIFTNNFENLDSACQGIFVTDISDHYPVFHINWRIPLIEKDICVRKRVFSVRNKNKFVSELNDIEWEPLIDNHGAQSAFSTFYRKYTDIYNKHFPFKTIKKHYNNKKPWLTLGLRNAIKHKNKLYSKYRKIKSAYWENLYKTYRNKLHHLQKSTERKYYSDLMSKYKGNMKKSWGLIKRIINKNKISKLQHKFKTANGIIISDKLSVSNHFNDFYINVGPTLAKAIPQQQKKPEHFLGTRVNHSIFLDPVSPAEIISIIKSLKDSATGCDDIGASTLRLSLDSISNVLTDICNLSLLEGVFPDELKVANVIPLYKSDDPMLVNNYRPVSLLNILSKVFEKVMYKRLLDFLNKHKIIFKYQFGFRKGYSTYMAMMILMDKLIKSLENGEFVIGIFLDFSKAFDTVDHDILLSKLAHYGIRGCALEWFKSYLSNRTQFVTYNGISSASKTVKCGVPQGSILGPLLFLIYINDLANICHHTLPYLFADDTNLFKSGTDLSSMQKDINVELVGICEWLKVNKLSLNVGKTKFMLFTKKRKYTHNIDIKIEGQSIAETENTKFLGVIIDRQLNWKAHISHIAGKVSRGIGILIKAKYLLNKDALISLYYSFVYSYITYCCHVWGNAYPTNLRRLIVLQKKAVRIITNVKAKAHTAPLFAQLNFVKVADINKYLVGKFMYRYHHGKVPDIFNDMFVYNYDVHLYRTRTANSMHVPRVRSNLGKSGIQYNGTIIWNKILDQNISLKSDYTFNKMFKQCIIHAII